jgi:hypothetical protein
MRWRKLGVVFKPDASMSWAMSHAMTPTPVLIEDNVIRVYATFCDNSGVGRPAWVDVDADNPLKVLAVSPTVLMDVGRPGMFDDNGVLSCSVVKVDVKTFYMYYVGFELCTKIRYRLLSGLAISEDGGETFRRYQESPILERSSTEPYFRCGPFVLKENDCYRMWYVAGSEWLTLNEKLVPVYSMKYLESPDGLHWPDEGETCLEITGDDEHGFGRPWVVKHSDTDYELFYSIRRKSLGAYRLGYATSIDGRDWARRDREMGLDVSSAGWDSEAIMYSAVIEAHGKTYCFYNGNNFGETGFGVAVLESR